MIVIDEGDPDAKVAQREGLASSTSQVVSESSQLVSESAPPPAYSSTAQSSSSYNAPLRFPQDVLPVHSQSHSRPARGERAGRRFLKAFGVAWCVWFLFAIFVSSLPDFGEAIVKNPKIKIPDDGKSNPGKPKTDEPESDGRIRLPSCTLGANANTTSKDNHSSNAPYSIKLEFSLPVNSDLSFFGNDTYSHGSFAIDTFESESSNVEVDVVISYRTSKALRRSKICLFETGAERTIGIMNTDDEADSPSSATLLVYDVFVRLPVSNKNTPQSPLYISRLTADFKLMGIGIGDLAERVTFGHISLKTGYKSIAVYSLDAQTAQLETVHASIKGNFSAWSSLELRTENAPIDAYISMLNSGYLSSNHHHPTRLAMHTTNAGISAQLDLANPTSVSSSPDFLPAGKGGNFSIFSTTSYAPLALTFLSQPVFSFLEISARTVSASAEINLRRQFSGTFFVETSIMRPALEVTSRPDPEDDESGRWRGVEVMREELHLLEGEVAWNNGSGRIDAGGGSVDLRTSILPTVLRL